MNDTDDVPWYVYHLRDPNKSAGFGYDGYIGITRNPKRRKVQHLSALAAGRHRNPKLQAEHDASVSGVQFWIVFSGPREQVLARERLLVPKAHHHLNRQIGGGPLRGLGKEQALAAAFSERRPDGDDSGAKPSPSKPSAGTSGSLQAAGTGGACVVGGESSVGAATGARSTVAGAGTAATAVGAGLLTVGVGAAYVMSKTVFKDEEGLCDRERIARSNGRVASYAGGVAGAAGTLAAIGASGTVVGLSGSGIAAGVTAIGAGIGGSVVAGTAIVIVLPVVAACGIGYGTYRISKWMRS